MLQFIRKGLSSPIALGILALVVVAFIITGVGDPFAGSATRQGVIATVGDRTISEGDLLRTLDTVLQTARQQTPDATLADLANDGAVGLMADQLVGRAAIEVYAESLGLAASDRAVGAVIAAIPAFQVAGKFDQDTYNRVISQQRLSDAQLRQDIAGDISRKALLSPLTAAMNMPAGMATPLAQSLVDIRRGGVALVPPGTVTPATDAEVTAFYTANRSRFAVPERRGFRYALLDPAQVAVTVTDADIAAAFAKDPARYGAAPTRRLLQVVVPDEARAKAVAAAAATEGFAAAAQRLAGFGAADIAIGEKSQSALAAETSPAVAAAAFALPVGGISAPVRSAFGWHVLSLEAMGNPARSLAQVRDTIRQELTARAAADGLAATVARIEEAAEDGKSFADVATAERLNLFSQPPVTREGASIDAAPLEGVPARLAALAFAQQPEDGIPVQRLEGEQRAAIAATTIVGATVRPLAEIKRLVAELAARDTAVKASRARADAIVAAVKSGPPFAQAVTDADLPAPRPPTGRRVDVLQQPQVPPLIQAFLTTQPGTTRVIGGMEGWALVHVAEVTPGNLAEAPGLVDAMRREIAGQLPNEFAEALAAAAEREIKATRNTAAVDAVRRRLSGAGAADPAS
ncbi:peptidylprolyl isomerase [Polymorphobacter multimanifer]|uniref:peptidylprolyl isomerase n=1 Tax=Polymorphobacter multimanifer TaxID=1070431 RepID=UPI00166CD1E5|nr:peptidylprolyl isomerase [Polymorphobacter multimanifer]GGI86346.1 peptidylprolyl isomerase [Polymorphobacter multimanifer]